MSTTTAPPKLVPPFTLESAHAKVKAAQNLWNMQNPEKIALAYTQDSIWRNRTSFTNGRPEIVELLERKWAREKDYILRKELFAFTDNRIAVQFWYEYRDATDGMKWKRCYGLEDWTFAEDGLMRKRQMSGNDLDIEDKERFFKGLTADEVEQKPALPDRRSRSHVAIIYHDLPIMNIDDYRQMRERLSSILESLPFLTCNVPQPPLLDMDGGSTFGGGHNEVVGIKNFKISAERDIEVLDTYISQHSNTTGPLPPLSTNAPYILAVWSEIIAASPVHAVGKTFNLPKEKGRGKDAGSVKVDVVADEGRQWIRVNTIKNSRLMAEIHELDGYESESSESSLPASGNIVTQSHENSILRMAKALLAAAKHHTVPDTGETPRVTIRLTRLEVDPTSSSNEPIDSRIARTIQDLETLGVDVRLGERPFPPRLLASSTPSPTPPRPTLRVNLDLSLIIALVSDLSHAPLPLTEDGAQERFRPLTRVWKSGKLLRSSVITNPDGDEDADTNDDQPTEDGEDVVKDSHEHSRALALQLLSEMRHSLLDEMASYLKPERDQPPLEFWTTPEAKQRCMKIVDKIGGVGERRRAQALFEPNGEAAFWQDSRFSTGFIPALVPVRIYPQNVPATPALDITKTATSFEMFARRLFRTCRILLFPLQARTVQGTPAEIGYATELTPPVASASQSIDTGTPSPSVLAGSRPNTRLTAHTVRSMLWGAARRVTTLTANRASVRAVLREMKVLAGVGMDSESDRTNDVELDAGRGEDQTGHEVGDEGVAVLWIVEPRSLAEQMRSDVVSTRV